MSPERLEEVQRWLGARNEMEQYVNNVRDALSDRQSQTDRRLDLALEEISALKRIQENMMRAFERHTHD